MGIAPSAAMKRLFWGMAAALVAMAAQAEHSGTYMVFDIGANYVSDIHQTFVGAGGGGSFGIVNTSLFDATVTTTSPSPGKAWPASAASSARIYPLAWFTNISPRATWNTASSAESFASKILKTTTAGCSCITVSSP